MTHRSARLASLLLVAFLAAGCQDGQKYPFGKKAPLTATRIELTRVRPAVGDQPAVLQKLALDLTDGRASFVDSDGRTWPHQMAPAILARVREITASRAWQVRNIKPAAGAQAPVRYTMNAYDGDRIAARPATWVVPARKPLPEALVVLNDAFDHAQRVAHPLSKNVNLID